VIVEIELLTPIATLLVQLLLPSSLVTIVRGNEDGPTPTSVLAAIEMLTSANPEETR